MTVCFLPSFFCFFCGASVSSSIFPKSTTASVYYSYFRLYEDFSGESFFVSQLVPCGEGWVSQMLPSVVVFLQGPALSPTLLPCSFSRQHFVVAACAPCLEGFNTNESLGLAKGAVYGLRLCTPETWLEWESHHFVFFAFRRLLKKRRKSDLTVLA